MGVSLGRSGAGVSPEGSYAIQLDENPHKGEEPRVLVQIGQFSKHVGNSSRAGVRGVKGAEAAH